MVVEARIARTGVLVYRNPDGSERREYRSDAETRKMMDSFRLVPLTNGHPPTMLTAANAMQYSVGAVGENIRRDGKWVVAPVVIHDQRAVSDIERGKTQVSCGYECDLIMKSGVSPDGERYDCEQIDGQGNHLAIEYNARAGKDAAIRMDAAHHTSTPENYMDLAQALAALAAANVAIGTLTQRADTAEKAITGLQTRLDKAEGERDAAKDQAATAERARLDAANGQTALVNERVVLLASAGRILGADMTAALNTQRVRVDGVDRDLTSIDERGLKLAVIKHVTNTDCSVDASGKPRSMDYINARFDSAVEQSAVSAQTFRGVNDAINDGRRLDSGPAKGHKDAADEYAKMVDENRNGWKKSAVK